VRGNERELAVLIRSSSGSGGNHPPPLLPLPTPP
jgi:hypothetical protein